MFRFDITVLSVLQQSVDQMTIQEQSNQIEELQLEKEQLKEQLASLQSQVNGVLWDNKA